MKKGILIKKDGVLASKGGEGAGKVDVHKEVLREK